MLNRRGDRYFQGAQARQKETARRLLGRSCVLGIAAPLFQHKCFSEDPSPKENDAVLPWNNYAWSKLGGECAVQMYENSLILRVCMTEKPFIHKRAFSNVKLNFIFHEELAKILIKILDRKGIINIGGPTKTVYDFAKKYNSKVKKIINNKKSKTAFPLKPYMNLTKLNKIIR